MHEAGGPGTRQQQVVNRADVQRSSASISSTAVNSEVHLIGSLTAIIDLLNCATYSIRF